MPNVVRIPTSLSRGGKCVTNMRGVFKEDGTPYDFVNPGREIIKGAQIDKVKTNTGVWSSSIPWAYTTTDVSGDLVLTYPSLVSSARSGTVIFRMLIKNQASPPSEQAIFINGNVFSDGYGILLAYQYDSTLSQNVYNIYFTNLRDPFLDRVQLNDNPLSLNTWYQFSVAFDTQTVSASTYTTLYIYQDGIASRFSGLTLLYEILTPTNATSLMGFVGSLTDFALIEEVLPTTQLAVFGKAPYL